MPDRVMALPGEYYCIDAPGHGMKIYRCPILSALFGGIAQLGECLNGIQEVSGSIPLISTKEREKPCSSSDTRFFPFLCTLINRFKSILKMT